MQVSKDTHTNKLEYLCVRIYLFVENNEDIERHTHTTHTHTHTHTHTQIGIFVCRIYLFVENNAGIERHTHTHTHTHWNICALEFIYL